MLLHFCLLNIQHCCTCFLSQCQSFLHILVMNPQGCNFSFLAVHTFFNFAMLKGPKLLDLDLMNGVMSEEGDSEMSLKVDLQHFGEVCICT